MFRPVCLSLLIFAAGPLVAQDADAIRRGAAFAQDNCAACHALGAEDASPHPDAPLLRHIGRRYPVAHLEEAFAEGVSVGHPDMPEFAFSEPEQIRDLLAWLESIQD